MTRRIFAVAAAMAIAGCALDNQGAPQLTGPSELGLSLAIGASPDVISQDGASQSVISVVARDANSQPVPALSIRVQTWVNGSPVDFGTLSTKATSTGGDGRATIVYTAPPPNQGGDILVQVALTPVGTNFGNTTTRFVDLLLTPPGVIQGPSGTRPTAVIIASPTSPRVGDKVFFDGTGSFDPDGNIVSYQWRFGDGDTASGPTAEHSYDIAGTYTAALTVTDSRGLTHTATVEVTVGVVDKPTADFAVSPSGTLVAPVTVHFNGALSTAAPEHTIVSWVWDFGDGSFANGETVSHLYATPGVYAVVLKVTDNFGLSATITKTVTIGP